MEASMRFITVLRLLIYCCVAIPASAQSTFANMRREALPTVFVTDRAGHETRGQLLSMTDAELTVKTDLITRTFTPDEVSVVERKGDSLKNGTLIGLGVGTWAAGMFVAGCVGSHSHCSPWVIPWALGVTGLYTALGAGIDAAIPGRTRIWPGRKVSTQRTGGPIVSLLPRRAFVGWRLK
jgi:hypothetical protein